MKILLLLSVPDPDLGIRGGGGGWSSRPLDEGGGGLQKQFFRPFGPQFGLKIRGREGGARAPPLDLLLIMDIDKSHNRTERDTPSHAFGIS